VELSGLRPLYVLTNRFRRPEPETAAVASLIIGVKALLAIKHRAEREWLQSSIARDDLAIGAGERAQMG
jgi:hypothetical protein